MRGKLLSDIYGICEVRITPACAGKTRAAATRERRPGDHPRVCGENIFELRGASPALGSPPRVRGKQVMRFRNMFEQGITPACAGKTTPDRCGKYERWDHPRVCGENNQTSFVRLPNIGSPPRVRGKLNGLVTMPDGKRITPACAGKTGHKQSYVTDM